MSDQFNPFCRIAVSIKPVCRIAEAVSIKPFCKIATVHAIDAGFRNVKTKAGILKRKTRETSEKTKNRYS